MTDKQSNAFIKWKYILNIPTAERNKHRPKMTVDNYDNMHANIQQEFKILAEL